MADDNEDESEKPYEATPRKLEQARERGEVPKSTDLIAAGAYGGFFLAALVFGASSIESLGQVMSALIGRGPEIAAGMLADGGDSVAIGMMSQVLGALSPWLVLPAATAFLVILAQRSFTVSGKKLAPKLSRISPVSNFKNRFGRSGLFEFFKSLTKLTVISVALAIFLHQKWPDIMRTMALGPNAGAATMMQLSVGFLGAVIGIGAAIGIVDYLWQYAEHLRKNRMSHKELMDETKQAEGDPALKQERRERGVAIANNRMLADVPTADVVIVNPEHYAVALAWDRQPGSAPTCVAKGVDHIAFAIREIAQEEGVPIRRDPPTARALNATTEVGQEIAHEHYRAVAAAIRFAEKVRRKARKSDDFNT
ncbi:MAG: flagellar type III secretion system protein FlhB [Pseudomonadota bacterium]